MLYSVLFQINKKDVNDIYIDLETKDHRKIRFIMKNINKGKELCNTIRSVAFPNYLSKDVFALKYRYALF